MKRYLIFTYYAYYPSGGMDDFFDSIDDLTKLEELLCKSGDDLFHVYDSLEMKYVIEEMYICDYIKQ